jgi:heterogeneous nuclear ribonucleoprotein A1/A3
VGGSMGGGQRSSASHLNKIFVGGLPSQVGEAEFSNFFAQFGEVVDAQVMIDHQTGNSRGFGFISFADPAAVELVVGSGRSSTRHEIMGKTVEVKRAEPKGSTGAAGGGGDRRNRDSYGAGGAGAGGLRGTYGGSGMHAGGMHGGANNPGGAVASAGAAGGAAAAGGAYAGYSYPASVMEQYGQYYNNPQWQQYYAAMGYNMQQYPQGFNPYTYYAAYMNSAAGGASAGDADSAAVGGAGGAAPDHGSVPGAPGNGGGGDQGGGGMRGGGGGGYGGGGNGSGGGAMGGNSGGAGAGRRSSRRDDRFHPYR